MKKKILCLAITLIMIVGASLTVHAEDYQGSKEWLVNFNGKKIESNFASDELADDMENVQPGDSITFQVELANGSTEETDWYMTNQVLQTLEESNNSAEGGAYTYILTYTDAAGQETILYSSDVVGGEEDPSKAGEGLHQATDSLKDYFYLDRMKAGEKGSVRLYIEIEGETTGIDYQETLAKLQMTFAVEVAGKVVTIINTGDSSRLLFFSAAMLISGIALLALAAGSMGKRRYRKGE